MKTMTILYEDNDIIVVTKPAGVPTQTRHFAQMDLEHMLLTHVHQKKGRHPYIGVVHRLDQPVEGILVFGKKQKATACLSKQLQQFDFSKGYLALVKGDVQPPSGTFTDALLRDGKSNSSAVVPFSTPGSKKAILTYERLSSFKGYTIPSNTSLLKVTLKTGRHHQIRVQLSYHGHPIIGDVKYGSFQEEYCSFSFPALCAYHLQFRHPSTKKSMEFTITPTWFSL